MGTEQKRFVVYAEDGPAVASSDTYDGSVTACLWLEQQEEQVGKPLSGGRFRICDNQAPRLARNMSTPEAVEFWSKVEASAATLENEPAWVQTGIALGATVERLRKFGEPRLCDCTPEPSCAECEKWYAERAKNPAPGSVCDGCETVVDDDGICCCA